jgi:hypothetical protein
MSLEFPFPLDSLRTAVTVLSWNVSRNVLHEALINSKLVRKDIARDELKRICGSSESWLKYVLDRLTVSELIGQMLAVKPAERPTADTLTGELSRARQEQDWRSYLCEALHSDQAETIFEKALSAALSAPTSERPSQDYIDLLDLLVSTAHKCGRTVEIARQLVQSFLKATLQSKNGNSMLATFVRNLLEEPVTEMNEREDKRIALRYLIDYLHDDAPDQRLIGVVDVLLAKQSDAVVWEMRHEVYVVGALYTTASLLQGRCEPWCVSACRRVRPLESGLLEAQLWLGRAERLSVTRGSDFIAERHEVDRLLQNQASCATLPGNATSQDDKVIGADERGHLDDDRIESWAGRVRSLYPFVYSIKRVGKEPNKVGSTRLLSTEGMSHHIKAAPGIKESRLVPALLDRSYCGSADTMLRINIILSENCTSAQREAAIELLSKDRNLFPGGRSNS